MAKKKLNKSQVIEKILELFEQYQDTTGAILDDYVADSGMITELAAADKNLITAIEELDENMEDDFETVLKKLSDLVDKDEIEAEKILALLDNREIIDHINSQDYLTLKIESPFDRDKLEEFARKEIYPYNINGSETIFL